MRKIIFAINTTIDGFADHTAGIVDDELHEFFTDLLDEVDVVLFGRKTYQLMESFWPHAKEDPRITESILKFADKFNSIAKVVFSKTLNEANWNNTLLNKGDLITETLKLKNQGGKSVSAGSISIANALMAKNLIDEYWLLIHPIILGKGKKLFDGFDERMNLQLIDTKKFNSGVVVLHYQKK